MAVNGLNGVLLWSIATAHELFASNCNLDINSDGIKDCVFGGRMAVSLIIFQNQFLTQNFPSPSTP